MKKILVVLGLIVASTAITTPSQAVEKSEVPAITAPIVALETSLSFSKVEVKTSPAAPVEEIVAPVVVPEVVTAPEVTVPQVVIPAQPTPEVGVQVRCEEDMPCWDCKTMGNKICGPVVEPAPVEPIVSDKCIEVYEDGSCLTENGFMEPGNLEEIITAPVEDDAPVLFDEPINDEPVADNGNPDCQVPDAIQWSDGSCTFPNPIEEEVK